MSRRIEIELTSARPDGSWTWRAAGAREPKGTLDGALLPEGAKAGDVLRADADFEIDGIVVTHVVAPKAKVERGPERIEVLGPQRGDQPGVTTSLVGRGGRGRRDDRGPRGDDRGPGDRRPRSDDRGPGDRRPRGDDRGPRRDGPAGQDDRRPRRDGPRPDGSRPDADRRPRRDDATAGGDRRPRRDGPATGPTGDRPQRGDARPGGGPRRDAGRDERLQRRRLNPGHVHRDAVLATLRPEEQAVAEQVLRGGLPAVRTALHLEREKAVAEGRPVPDTDALLTLAESLLPRLKTAEWLDRAEAAAKMGDDLGLRDLRSVVAGADAARDDATRALAADLRAALDRRVEAQRTEWLTDIGRHLDEGRTIKALQLSGRPPDPATRLPADVATRVAEGASASMTADTAPDRWLALLEAVAASPVRRSVKPVALPAEPGPDLLRAAHQQSGRVPALAAMLGVTMPPPPGRRPPRPAGPRSGGDAAAAASPAAGADAPAEPVASVEDATPTEAAPPVEAAAPVEADTDAAAEPSAEVEAQIEAAAEVEGQGEFAAESGEHPAGEHPAGEHPAGEHPAGEPESVPAGEQA